MTGEKIKADITAEATDYILDQYGDVAMKEPTEHRFQELLLKFETGKRMFLNNDEVLAVKRNLRWVWKGIAPNWLCPPDNIRVNMDNSTTGWKDKK